MTQSKLKLFLVYALGIIVGGVVACLLEQKLSIYPFIVISIPVLLIAIFRSRK